MPFFGDVGSQAAANTFAFDSEISWYLVCSLGEQHVVYADLSHLICCEYLLKLIAVTFSIDVK